MKVILAIISCYLSIYTFLYAKRVWREGHVFAGTFICLVALSFIPLLLLIVMTK